MHPYARFLPPALVQALHDRAEAVPGLPGFRVAPGLQAAFPSLENAGVLGLVAAVYRDVHDHLDALLAQRVADRVFIDARTRALAAENAGRSIEDPEWRTVIGERDGAGRIVVGPLPPVESPSPVVVPAELAGFQVTLFGPPDSARMAINAMNALHRQRAGEPPLVAALVDGAGTVPRWGADSEDSKTPIARDLLAASENLARCVDGTLELHEGGRHYTLAPHQRAIPIKRVAGLALPDGSHLLDGAPLPLHLVELVQHAALNRARPDALVYYLPKLENEEEAAYIASLVSSVERRLSLPRGTIRLLLVFENPRAIFRIQAMAAALHPWFLGGSLGWHDFLASTARLFRNDPGYRIPVKADPNIVIRNIRESHRILARDLDSIGALKIGGMYGVLPTEGDAESYTVSIVGFIRDVTTQLKRGLDGFWVAHPDFVRIGIALCEAWRQSAANPENRVLDDLVRALVPADEVECLLAFVHAPDAPGLDEADPRYLRAVLAADRGVSEVIANDDPEEVRYNLFQALQYLTDWLAGRGCVALPATMRTASGTPVFVRVMDDLATTERSRWELWAEVHHGRVSVGTLDAIFAEEIAFVCEGRATPTKRTQVSWHPVWSPIAARLLRAMVVTEDPPEFVTEWLLPFAQPLIRDDADPWARASTLCPGFYTDMPEVG